MGQVKTYLKETCHLTSYQTEKVIFLFKTLFSEASKMFLMGLLFSFCLPEYCFALFIMLFLRTSSGGMHFDTYAGCFIMSTVYIGLTILALPGIRFILPIKIMCLLLSALTCYIIGPVTSKYRPSMSERKKQTHRFVSAGFILLYTFATIVFSDVKIMNIGFWVILLHSLQLIIAKIIKKGEKSDV